MRKVKWTLEKIQEKALECKSKGEFSKKYQSVYMAARRTGVLDKVCSHMKKIKKWNKESIIDVVRSCKDKSDFYINHPQVYQEASRQNLIPQVYEFLSQKKSIPLSQTRIIAVNRLNKVYEQLQVTKKKSLNKFSIDFTFKKDNQTLKISNKRSLDNPNKKILITAPSFKKEFSYKQIDEIENEILNFTN